MIKQGERREDIARVEIDGIVDVCQFRVGGKCYNRYQDAREMSQESCEIESKKEIAITGGKINFRQTIKSRKSCLLSSPSDFI